jgi:alkyldihydroxyacetonephosphate synthase
VRTSTYAVWGWGRSESDAPTRSDLDQLAPVLRDHLQLPVQAPEDPAPLAELPEDRVGPTLPAALAQIASSSPVDRAAHSIGRSYRDIIHGIRGRLDHVVDCVLRPATESDVVAALEWCSDARVAVIPYSGGTSVVGGLEPRLDSSWRGVVSLDIARLSGVAEVDATSRAARVRAGTP